ncbi:Sec-independent protein translocase protein TatA [Hibiscus syriacus]|uniref:Sec-independent protein translocase protein TatA n=1 Tax=Hibiscus syriacus TaxID=106335 RepID=A0A6A2ZUW0_HIBSY|nr:Sec-independent protein translocase protein TatA [Hibiscus syriacus]
MRSKTELVVIAGVAALVFGPKKLPEVGKTIGKTVKSFQQVALQAWFPWNHY